MIAYCGCVAASPIVVKSAGARRGPDRPRMTHNFVERTRGAVFQDALYGNGYRLFNLIRKKPLEAQRGRCTVCEREQAV